MTTYLTPKSHLPPFMAFPRFLLEYDLNETAKVLYTVLLDRARVSMSLGAWNRDQIHLKKNFSMIYLVEFRL